MKLKVSSLFKAQVTLTTIINEKRALPSKGQYRVARMHEKLSSEFKVISDKRDSLIKEFGDPVLDENDLPTGGVSISPMSAKWAEYSKAWEDVGNDEIEVEVQPIPLDMLGDTGSITAADFLDLGDLVCEA